MSTVRKPAVAGQFYPDDAQALQTAVRTYLDAAERLETVPKGIIVPHAGYVYSGPIAGSGYAQLEPAREKIHRVVLMGPCHFVPLRGLAVSTAEVFETPLGMISVDQQAMQEILELPQVSVIEAAHAREHSLEVHLPFLQVVLEEFSVVPLVVGDAAAEEVAEVVERLWGGPETLFVISSDLSHFNDYETANRLDRETSQAIVEMRFEDLRGDRACGYAPISGFLFAARKRGLQTQLLDLRNSGDTAGPRDRVVGYGAYVVE